MIQQLLVNGIISSSLVFMLACGFAIIYRTTHCFHFAHAVIFTSGAYLAFLFHRLLEVPFLVSFFFAIICSALLGMAIELVIYRPLRQKGSSPLVVLLASLGIYIALQNVISVCFGDNVETIRPPMIREGIKIFGARITPCQITIVVIGIVTFLAVTLLVRVSKFGKTLRAIADDSELASMCGIETNKAIVWVFALGSALAATAGILTALDTNMTPMMGMSIFLMAVVAVIIGGIRSIPGVALGALFLSMVQHLSVWKIGSQWQDAVAFTVLLLFMIVKPEEFLGKRARKVTV